MSDAVRLNSVKDVVARTRLSRSKVYEEMDSGRLQSVKVGRRRLVNSLLLRVRSILGAMVAGRLSLASSDPVEAAGLVVESSAVRLAHACDRTRTSLSADAHRSCPGHPCADAGHAARLVLLAP